MDTYFAPAKRTDQRKFKNQIAAVSHNPIMNTLLKTITGILIILNEDRQVVAANHVLLESLGTKNIESVLGLRVGQVLSCIHSEQLPNGCGTTPECMTCGAAIAMMATINENKTDEQICFLTKNENSANIDICLKVRAQPITIDNQKWILFFAQDITQEQQWLNMERVFFHDISNILTTIVGNNELLSLDLPENRRIQHNKMALAKLCNEVTLQMNLLHQKDNQYLAKKEAIYIEEIKVELHAIIQGHLSSKGKTIKESWPDKPFIIHSDSLLLTKVLSNMIINALEATPKNGEIKIDVQAGNKKIIWKIWNCEYIPKKYHNRIFQRFFSTKVDQGRGLGTYSMKIYGEKFLPGKIGFSSDKEKGTLFSYTLPV